MTLATLIIDRYSSSCSACGGNADPEDTYHLHGGPGSMYDPDSSIEQQNGCGAKFTRVEDRCGEATLIVPQARERIERGAA